MKPWGGTLLTRSFLVRDSVARIQEYRSLVLEVSIYGELLKFERVVTLSENLQMRSN